MIRRELILFLFVGSSTVLVDFIGYKGLLLVDLMNVDVAKAISFILGTVYAYFANKYWTFGHKQTTGGSVYRFAGLYAVTLLANVLVNAFALVVLGGFESKIQIAFVLATGVSATLNFLGMKFFVFTSNATESVS